MINLLCYKRNIIGEMKMINVRVKRVHKCEVLGRNRHIGDAMMITEIHK